MSDAVVTVQGEARLEAPPDRASVQVMLHSSGMSPEAVSSMLAGRSVEIRGALARFARAIAKSSTSGVHVGPVFDPNDATRITGYTGSVGTTIELQDLDQLAGLIGDLTRLRESQVDGPWWSLSADHPLRREARLAAVTDAQSRAADYAAAVGAELGDLVEISELDGGFVGGVGRRMFSRDSAESVPFDFEPEQQEVTGRVMMRFTLSGEGSSTP